MPLLGALLGLGSTLIGGAMAKRQQNQAQAQADRSNRANQGVLDQFQSQYGGTYDSTIARAGAGETMYDNSLGLNGPGGNAAAVGAFQAGPGYQFALDQQQQAAERGAAAGGYTASGNLLDQLQRNAAGYASQEYGNWQDRLGGYNQLGLAGREGKASLGSLVATGRMNINNQGADMAQANANNAGQRLGVLGGLAGQFLGSSGIGAGNGGFLGSGYSVFK